MYPSQVVRCRSELKSKVTGTKWGKDDKGNFALTISTQNYPQEITWTLEKSGLLKLEASPLEGRLKDIDYVGIGFNYPEEKCTGIKWMGRGPYRVWKNRLKGANIGVWEKALQ